MSVNYGIEDYKNEIVAKYQMYGSGKYPLDLADGKTIENDEKVLLCSLIRQEIGNKRFVSFSEDKGKNWVKIC